MLGEPVFAIVMVTVGLAVILRGVTIMIWGPSRSISPPAFDRRRQRRRGAVLSGPALSDRRAGRRDAAGLAVPALHPPRHRDAGGGRQRDGGIACRRQRQPHSCHGLDAVVGDRRGCRLLFAANFKLAPDLWFQGLKSFPAVILGGLDSVIGAALAGIIIGMIENLSQGYIGQGLREISGFIVIIVVLMVRPYGLFGIAKSSGSDMRTGITKKPSANSSP